MLLFYLNFDLEVPRTSKVSWEIPGTFKVSWEPSKFPKYISRNDTLTFFDFDFEVLRTSKVSWELPKFHKYILKIAFLFYLDFVWKFPEVGKLGISWNFKESWELQKFPRYF